MVPLEPNRSVVLNGYSRAVDLIDGDVLGILRDPAARARGEEVDYLLRRGYLMDVAPEVERRSFAEMATAIHEHQQQRFLKQLVFILTYACNLDCYYCYQKGLPRTLRALSVQEAGAVFAALDRSSVRVGKIELYGGEPFLLGNREVIAFIMDEAARRGAIVSATSNLTNLEPFLDLVGRLDRVQVTLEGPRWMHDQRRFARGKAPTFDRILRNVERLLETPLRLVSVRVNLDRLNMASIPELDDFLLAWGWGQREKLEVYAAEVRDGPHSITSWELDRFVRTHCRCIRSGVKKMMLKILRGNVLNIRTVYCDAHNQIYASPGGNLHVCPETPGYIGSVAEERLVFQEEELAYWQKPFTSRPECVACPYAVFCGGGCLNLARRSGEGYYATFCEQYRKMLDENLALIARELERSGAGDDLQRPAQLLRQQVDVRGQA